MALNVKINFEECYDIETITSDLSLSKFNTVLKNEENVTNLLSDKSLVIVSIS